MSECDVRHAVILAGGQSLRMGRNKALIDYLGKPLVRHVADKLRTVFANVLVATGDQEVARAAGCPAIADLVPGHGPLGGIHAALRHCNRPILCVACDMPYLNTDFLVDIAMQLGEHDAAIPMHAGYLEPLHAAYSPSCLPTFDLELQRERTRRFAIVLEGLDVVTIAEEEAARFDPELRTFQNWNTPADID